MRQTLVFVAGRRGRQVAGRLGGAYLRWVADEAGRPIRCRGFPRVRRLERSGRLLLGNGVHAERGLLVVLHGGAAVAIGDRTYLNENVRIEAVQAVRIGRGCLVGNDVAIVDSDLHAVRGLVDTRPVTIEDGVWIGMRATVLRGVTVGAGSIVAAGAVVTADVPARSMVAGVPAAIIRRDVEWAPQRDQPAGSGGTPSGPVSG